MRYTSRRWMDRIRKRKKGGREEEYKLCAEEQVDYYSPSIVYFFLRLLLKDQNRTNKPVVNITQHHSRENKQTRPRKSVSQSVSFQRNNPTIATTLKKKKHYIQHKKSLTQNIKKSKAKPGGQ